MNNLKHIMPLAFMLAQWLGNKINKFLNMDNLNHGGSPNKPKGQAFVDALHKWAISKGLDPNKLHFFVIKNGHDEEQHINNEIAQAKKEAGIK